MQRRKTTGGAAGAARATLEPVARLTAALVAYLDGDPTRTTAAELYAIEAIANQLRRAVTRPNATIAIFSLTAADVFTAADRRAIEHFIQISKQR